MRIAAQTAPSHAVVRAKMSSNGVARAASRVLPALRGAAANKVRARRFPPAATARAHARTHSSRTPPARWRARARGIRSRAAILGRRRCRSPPLFSRRARAREGAACRRPRIMRRRAPHRTRVRRLRARVCEQVSSARCVTTRAKKQPHEESPESVPVEERSSSAAEGEEQKSGAMETQPRGGRRGAMTSGAGGIAPWAGLGGGLASVLPRMMMPSAGSILSDPFLSPGALLRTGGPFGVADRLLHELEDDMRSITGGLFGAEPEEGEAEEEGEGGALALPGLANRLWAAVDVKETPNEFVLSTDVRAHRAHRARITKNIASQRLQG
jgi:hypothetical protein